MTEHDNAGQPQPDNRLHRPQERKGAFFSPSSSAPTEFGPADLATVTTFVEKD